MRKAWPGSQGGTYGANAVACAAAVATLDVVRDEKLVENAEAMGARLRAGLEAVAARTAGIGEVRGLGLMLASEFVTQDGSPDPETAARVQRAAVDEGLLLLLCGAWNHVVRMIPALVIDETAVDEGLHAWTAAVEAGSR
jgi:4-aminobutyrate aminotransferase